MRDDEYNSVDEITTPEALASALEYLHAEARLAGFHFVAHLILVAAAEVEEELRLAGATKQTPRPRREYPPALRLLQGGLPSLPEKTEGRRS
ncbi:MAG: hypothetical protein OEZ03_00620 [Alphaproteobacteria bacterium]|nr:hypothetical protein [Alphaproteobacteria bacterium]